MEKFKDLALPAIRVLDPSLPLGNKAVGGILVGLLTAQVNKENAQKLLGFLGDR